MSLLTMVALLALSVPSASPSVSASPAPTTLHVRVNEQFSIRLPYTGGTGYGWQSARALPAHLTLLAQVREPQHRGMPGAPGIETFWFRMSVAGSAHLILEYVRPWEHGVEPARMQSFVIVAR